MLRPTKHSYPDETVIGLSTFILHLLQKDLVITFEKLKTIIGEKFPRTAPLIIPSLCFLFLLGTVEYRSATDSFIYLRKKGRQCN